MKPFKLSVAVAVALAFVPFASFAQEVALEEETESPFSWSVTATSDYVFRGVSQTDEGPALQADFIWTASSGFYAGAWASNVDFGSGGPNVEVDTFIGYSTDVGGDDFVNVDILLNRYNYLGGNGSDLAYNELLGTVTFAGAVGLTVGYTNDVYASGEDGWYVGVAGSLPLGNDYTLDASVGNSLFGDGSVARDYIDYSLGVGKSWGSFSASLAYVATNRDGTANFGPLADDRAVLTVTYSP